MRAKIITESTGEDFESASRLVQKALDRWLEEFPLRDFQIASSELSKHDRVAGPLYVHSIVVKYSETDVLASEGGKPTIPRKDT